MLGLKPEWVWKCEFVNSGQTLSYCWQIVLLMYMYVVIVADKEINLCHIRYCKTDVESTFCSVCAGRDKLWRAVMSWLRSDTTSRRSSTSLHRKLNINIYYALWRLLLCSQKIMDCEKHKTFLSQTLSFRFFSLGWKGGTFCPFFGHCRRTHWNNSGKCSLLQRNLGFFPGSLCWLISLLACLLRWLFCGAMWCLKTSLHKLLRSKGMFNDFVVRWDRSKIPAILTCVS